MNRSLTLLVACLTTAVAAAQTAPPPSSVPATRPASIAGMLARLGDADWSVRQAAEDALVEQGASAEPALRAELDRGVDPETVQRVASALARIEVRRLLSPTTVTIAAGTVEAALQQLARAADATIEIDTAATGLDAAVDAAALFGSEALPLFEAAGRLEAYTGRGITFAKSALRVGKAGSARRRQTALLGPVRMVANTSRSNKLLVIGTGQTTGSRLIEFVFDAEPRVRLRRSASWIVFNGVVGDDGAAVKLAAPSALLSRGVGDITATLALPLDPAVRSLKRLAGEATLTFFTREEVIEIDLVSGAAPVTRETVFGMMTVDPPRESGGGNYELSISTRLVGEPPPYLLQQELQEFLQTDTLAVTTDGQSWARGLTGGRNVSGVLTQTIRLTPPAGVTGPPDRLHLAIPAGPRTGVYAFEFEDIPLP